MKKAINVAYGMFPRAAATEEERTGFVDKEHCHDADTDDFSSTMPHSDWSKNGSMGGVGGGLGKDGGGMIRGEGEGDFDSPEQECHGELAESEKKKITEWQAGWNVTNAIQGMFIVTFPYSVYQGGYWSLFAMVFFAYITYYTGKILVYCLYDEDERGQPIRVRTSYIQIAEDVWGKAYGGKIVQAAQLIELIMTCVLYVLLCGDLLQEAFPQVALDLTSWIMLSSIFLLPCAFLQNYRAVARLSFYNTVSHACINIIIIGYCLTHIGQWHWQEVEIGIDLRQVPVALGIIVFSYTSQIFLPALEGSMQKRHRFECMLFWTHALAALFKCMFAWIGFLTFGNNTREVITNNLPDNWFRFITNIFLFLKALLSYPLPYFAACDIVQNRFFETRKEAEDNKFTQVLGGTCYAKDGLFKDWALLIRLLVVVFTMLLGAGIPHFAILMGLVGNFTGTMLSFVWPCVFHLKLKGHTLSPATKVWEYTIIGIGIVCGGIGIITSGIQLVEALQND